MTQLFFLLNLQVEILFHSLFRIKQHSIEMTEPKAVHFNRSKDTYNESINKV